MGYQFLVVLSETNRLCDVASRVSEQYSFWDLHVAIQDAMGWLDYHLHEFRVLASCWPSCRGASFLLPARTLTAHLN
jgi:hypothetical protein